MTNTEGLCCAPYRVQLHLWSLLNGNQHVFPHSWVPLTPTEDICPKAMSSYWCCVTLIQFRHIWWCLVCGAHIQLELKGTASAFGNLFKLTPEWSA